MNDGGCDWYCDGCSIELNSQSGFTVESGSWTCEVCGYVNDVSADNIISSEEAASKRDSLSNAVYMPMGGESVLMRQERWVTLFSHARIAVQQLLICSLSQRQNQNL